MQFRAPTCDILFGIAIHHSEDLIFCGEKKGKGETDNWNGIEILWKSETDNENGIEILWKDTTNK